MISKGRVIRAGLLFSMVNFLFTVLIGVLVRYNYLSPVAEFADRNWIHAHSHAGFLGWIFMALITMIFSMQIPKSFSINRQMYRLLVFFQISILGMLVTFPMMGYAAPSIFFSTAHMVLSAIFVVMFYRNSDPHDVSVRFIQAALVFMLISCLGPLSLGPMMVLGMKGSDIYDLAVYFYLHFQYNAWFTLAIFGLFIKLMENLGFPINRRKGSLILHLLVYASILTFALSALGFESYWYVRVVGLVGAILQLWAGFIFMRYALKNLRLARSVSNKYSKWFFGVALFAWLLKVMLQFISVIPVVTQFAYYNREAIMAYLHLSFLGFASCFLIGLLIIKKYLFVFSPMARVGYFLFITGAVLMEITVGLKAFPQLLSLEFFKVINILLLAEAVLLFSAVAFILFYGFIIPKRTINKNHLAQQ